MKQLARDDRPETFRRLQELRDQDADLRVSLEASKTLVAYSDGQPSERNVPEEDEPEFEAGPGAAVLEMIQPPEDQPEE